MFQDCFRAAVVTDNRQELYESALQKLAEFKRLGYPPGLLRGVCGYMAATTGRGGWILVRNGL